MTQVMTPPNPRRAVVVSLCCALLLSSACTGDNGGDPPPPPSTPPENVEAPNWEKVPPTAVGLDADKLDKLAAQARRGKSTCLAVVRYGKLAGEWYFRSTGQDNPQNTFSVTKSITSTLVGIAQDDGVLRIGDSASKWIPEWKGKPAEAVTIRNLLSMDSGRQWSSRTDYGSLVIAKDRTAFAVGLKQDRRPGAVWAYNNSAVQTLQKVLQNATGQDVTSFAWKRLFEPLGMTHSRMITDRAGKAQMFFGVQSTCRDLARFGTLMLNNGQWNGKRIVSAGWIDEATGRSSTELNAAYGYLWWLNRRGVIAGPLAATDLRAARDPKSKRGRLVPGAPERMYWALGLGNQVVQVDPASKTVVVRLGTPEVNPEPPTFGPAEASKVVTDAIIR